MVTYNRRQWEKIVNMNPFKAPLPTEYTFLSLGAGVQSTCLALMAAMDELLDIKVDAAIFADTGGEPFAVYDYLKYLEDILPYPVYTVQKGNLADEAVRVRPSSKGGTYVKSIVPAFIDTGDGKVEGMIGRACTQDYKIIPVNKKVRELAKIKRGQDYVTVTTLIGISMDEIQRVKPARAKFIQHRWPLLELDMTRQSCKDWITNKGYKMPPRSACTFCPYHSNYEWRRLKKEDPRGFEEAVHFEKRLQESNKVADKGLKGVPYLHRSLVPLEEADFNDDDPRQMWLWGNECEGMCGV